MLYALMMMTGDASRGFFALRNFNYIRDLTMQNGVVKFMTFSWNLAFSHSMQYFFILGIEDFIVQIKGLQRQLGQHNLDLIRRVIAIILTFSNRKLVNI